MNNNAFWIALFLFLRICLYSQPTLWYFSSSQGNDNNTGLSPSSPWQSMDRLQSLLNGTTFSGKKLQKGDTIYFLRGDTFYVTRFSSPTNIKFNVSFNTTVFTTPPPMAGSYVTLRDYGSSSSPMPVFRGTIRLDKMPAGTVVQQGNLIKISNIFHPNTEFIVTRMFFKDKPMIPCRFPNDTLLRVDASNSGSTYTIHCSYLSTIPNSFVDSALFWGTSAGFTWVISMVTSKTGSVMLVKPGNFTLGGPTKGAGFYLQNKKEFLDKPGEWYYDKHTDTLYFLLPQAAGNQFNIKDYEVQFIQKTGASSFNYPILFSLSAPNSQTIMTSTPISDILVKNLNLERCERAFNMSGVKNFTVTQCRFRETYTSIQCQISDNVHIRENKFFDTQFINLFTYGSTASGCEGNPLCYTRNIYFEKNEVKRNGLGERWMSSLYNAPLTTNSTWQVDASLKIGPALENVYVRYNRFDSLSQQAINSYNYSETQVSFANAYNGNVPFIIEKNYISRYCMDFNDCGAIKANYFLNNSVIKNNIIEKDPSGKDNRWFIKKRCTFLTTHFGGNACGIYTDVNPYKVFIDGNTVIGADANINLYPSNISNSFIKRNIVKNNIMYGANIAEYSIIAANVSNNIDSNEVEGNLFFHINHAFGCIRLRDHATNNKVDSIYQLNKNRYFTPNNSAILYNFNQLWASTGYERVYGFNNLKAKTNYEASPVSYWAFWAKDKYWSPTNVVQATLINNTTFTASPYPISVFSGAQMATVATSPFGTSCMRIVCPTVTSAYGAGFITTTLQPFYTTTLNPHHVYKISIAIAANKIKDFVATLPYDTKNPVTGDVTSYINEGADYLIFPIRKKYTPDTFNIRYSPRFYQYNNQFRFVVEKNDTVWIKFLKIEQIDTSTIKPNGFYYPIFINPSDNVKSYSLNPCYVYLDTDSNVVVGTVTVAPWSSKILIWQKCDSTILFNTEESKIIHGIMVYPNPAHDVIHIMNGAYVDCSIYDITGQLIFTGRLSPGVHSIPVSNLSPGLYIVRTVRYSAGDIEEKVSTFKFIKQ